MKKRSHSRLNDRLVTGLLRAFLDCGYENVTMVRLASACGVTRRTLYNHFSNKEEAFRAVLRSRHAIEIDAGMAAGEQIVGQGGSALDAFVAIMDTRYGEARRALDQSPHAVEINYTAFRRCRDVMIDSAVRFQQRVATFVAELIERDLLRLRPDVTPADLAQLLADGARGVNQSLPPLPAVGLPDRYRRMFAAILSGCTVADVGHLKN
jgi:AcrR family transcriptional regulator